MSAIKVLVVDDSAVVRQLLSRELSRAGDIEVIATAPDPYAAREAIARCRPDVITLDVEMPRMDGITFLGHLMKAMPIPTVVLSSLTPAGSRTAVAAMAAGAVAVVCKPAGSFSAENVAQQLIEAIRMAARSRPAVPKPMSPLRAGSLAETTHKLIAIGSSTGGVQALSAVIPLLPGNCPGVLIVQHMPADFTRSFADRLNAECAVKVKEAADGDPVLPGQVLIAPGEHHMVLRRSGARYLVNIVDGPRVHHQKPAVDVLFDSVAKIAGPNAVGVVMTGMGEDGAAGLLAMREAGASTIAQDEATSVVWGMPGAAVKRNAAQQVVPLGDLCRAMLTQAARRAA